VTGKEIRLSKLFDNGNRAVVVAIDHGQTFGPMEGLVDYPAAAGRLKAADAVLLAPQMVRFTGDLFVGRSSPAMIVRLNWNTIHCEPWQYQEARIVKACSAAAAARGGADVLLASLTLKTGSEAHDAENVRLFAALAEEAAELGMPLIGEVFPAGGLRSRPDEFHDYVKKCCRIICELGADAIKTFYTGDRFAEVVEGTPIPVFALGAEKLPRQIDALNLAAQSVAAGARGVVYGRNVLQADRPSDFLAGLKDVVQGRATPEEAAARYGLQ
jgi:DhnA family fructose-bisphosphate aldolase class Ia